jgi:hypothetical protein
MTPSPNAPKFPPIPDRVEAGIRLLNSRRAPARWLERIDVEAIDLVSCRNCILGQVFGEYGAGIDALDLDEHTVITHGFDLGHIEEEQHEQLTVVWRERIEAMRVAGKAA